MKILIVEDDTLLLQGLILAAQTEGYACDGVSTARAAEQCLETGHYSLVVLDLGLPDEDGLHFLTRIRQKKYTLPVLILTARDTLGDKISGLDVGADDYLVKPFALEELHARIRALLRRHNNQGESELVVGNLTLNMGRRQVWKAGEELILTPKEYALLSRLMLKSGARYTGKFSITTSITGITNRPPILWKCISITCAIKWANPVFVPCAALATCWWRPRLRKTN